METMETYVSYDEMNRLRWKCRRGMKEMDILLERFLEQYYADADTETQIAFSELLEMQDADLYELLIKKVPSDSDVTQAVIAKIHQCL